MSPIAELRCRCGQVEGTVSNASPESVNRIICYCDDCQAFLHHIGRSELLDAHGGTDIVQVAPADLRFHRGKAWPHPFFARATRAPAYPVTTLSSAERDALRPLCGPHPVATSHG